MKAQLKLKESIDNWRSSNWVNNLKNDPAKEWERHFCDLKISMQDFHKFDVLDVGCGASGAIYYLPPGGRRVGIDPSAEGIATWNLTEGQRHQIELIGVEAEKMPFKENEFDAVFCINCLDHTKEPQKIVKEIYRVLKKDGKFVFHFDIDSPLRKLHKILKPKCKLHHPHSLSYNWVKNTILESGLFDIESTHRDTEYFKSWAAKKYEAYWDDLIYKITGSNLFINHLWITGNKI